MKIFRIKFFYYLTLLQLFLIKNAGLIRIAAIIIFANGEDDLIWKINNEFLIFNLDAEIHSIEWEGGNTWRIYLTEPNSSPWWLKNQAIRWNSWVFSADDFRTPEQPHCWDVNPARIKLHPRLKYLF